MLHGPIEVNGSVQGGASAPKDGVCAILISGDWSPTVMNHCIQEKEVDLALKPA